MAHAVGASSIGTQYFEDGSSQPLLAGSASNVQIWLDYIAAHNSRDFDTIAAMNTEDFRGVAPHGEVVDGIAAHTAFLQDWMAAENPRWEVWWAIANDGANADGAMEEWLATGNIVTTTGADGTESRAYETIDVLLEGGKIKALNVASQTMPE